MIVNLASGRGALRVVNQKNSLLIHSNRFQNALLEHGNISRRKKSAAKSKMLLHNKKQNLANRYCLLAKEVEQFAYKVMETGDALRGETLSKDQPTKEDVLQRLKEVEVHSTIELETRRLKTIISNLSALCPETDPKSTAQSTLSQLETANGILAEAKEFLEIAVEKEKEIIATYEMIEQYGDVVAELVDAYNALDVLEEMVGKQVKIEISKRDSPIGKEAIFRLFRKRMIGTIEDLKNPAGEIYEQRIHTITTGEWGDMIEAVKQGVGAATETPSKERITEAFKEALLVRNTFVFAARELYTKMGGKTKALEPREADVVPVDFVNGKKL